VNFSPSDVAGNELLDNAKSPAVDPRVYAEDVNHVHTLVQQVWAQSKHSEHVPFVIGPASSFNNNAYPFMLTIKPGMKRNLCFVLFCFVLFFFFNSIQFI
jgi:hypothetical protein